MAETSPIAQPRPEDFPFAEWQTGVEQAGERLTGRFRHCSRSAFLHLRKAWRLHGIDDEMSAFRTITAEEEAATAVILALKQQRYPGADRLKPWNHVHKSAFWPLVAAINDMLYRSGIAAPKIALTRTGQPRVALRIDLTALAGQRGEAVWAEPDEPLNFSLRTGEAPDSIVHMFEEELAMLADDAGESSILAYVKREANYRNRLLYASDGGVPQVSFDDKMLLERARRVGVLVLVAVIVLQTTQHQLFMVQCLEALLRALDAIGDEVFQYSEARPPADRPFISIRRTAGGPGRISLSRTIDVRFSRDWFGETWSWPSGIIPTVTYSSAGMDAS